MKIWKYVVTNKIETLMKQLNKNEKKYMKFIQIYRNACRKIFMWTYKRIYKKAKSMKMCKMYIKCI